eukprot:g757.t1
MWAWRRSLNVAISRRRAVPEASLASILLNASSSPSFSSSSPLSPFPLPSSHQSRSFSSSPTSDHSPQSPPSSYDQLSNLSPTESMSLSKRKELSYVVPPMVETAIELATRLVRNQQMLRSGTKHTPELVVTFDMHGAGKTNFGARFQRNYLTDEAVQQSLQSQYYSKPNQLAILKQLTQARNIHVNLLQLMPDPIEGATIEHALAYCVNVAVKYADRPLPNRDQLPPFDQAFLDSSGSQLSASVQSLLKGKQEGGAGHEAVFLHFDDIEWVEQELYASLWKSQMLRSKRFKEDDPFVLNVQLYDEMWDCLSPLLRIPNCFMIPNCFIYCSGLSDPQTVMLLHRGLLVLESKSFEPFALPLSRMTAEDVKLTASRTETPLESSSGEPIEDDPMLEDVQVVRSGPEELFRSSNLDELLALDLKGYKFLADRTAGLPSFVRELLWGLVKLRLSNPVKRKEDWTDLNTLIRAVEAAEQDMFQVGREAARWTGLADTASSEQDMFQVGREVDRARGHR